MMLEVSDQLCFNESGRPCYEAREDLREAVNEQITETQSEEVEEAQDHIVSDSDSSIEFN